MSATVSSVVDTILAALHAEGVKAERDDEEADFVFAPAPWSTSDHWIRAGMTVRVERPHGWGGRDLSDAPSAVVVGGSALRRQSYPVKNGAFAVAKVVERVRAGLADLVAERARRDEAEREQQANAKAERAELASLRVSLKASGATVARLPGDDYPPRYSVTWDHEAVPLDRLPSLLRALAAAKGAEP